MNVEEFQLTLKDIKADPASHDPNFWAARRYTPTGAPCGTAKCLAGFTVVRNGYALDFDDSDEAFECISPDGEREPIHLVAQRILRLTLAQAGILFNASNTVEDIERYGDMILRGEL